MTDFVMSGSGENAHKLKKGDVFVAIVTENWLNDKASQDEAQIAHEYGNPMISVVDAKVVKDPKWIAIWDRYKWVQNYIFFDKRDIAIIGKHLNAFIKQNYPDRT